MHLYALIGWPLGYSFSASYFTDKFIREGITDARYEQFPLESISAFPALLESHPNLAGINVTIPYKEAVIPYLHALDKTAQAVGAVNCIKFGKNKELLGYNTDVIGFERSFSAFIAQTKMPEKAYVFGTGGAAKAVAYILQKLGIPFQFVSRSPRHSNELHYDQLLAAHSKRQMQHAAFINCSPVGTFPKTEEMPPIPLEILNPGNLLFDLVYNPAETLLLREAKARGCFVQNGLDMLHLQAEAAWEIWQTET